MKLLFRIISIILSFFLIIILPSCKTTKTNDGVQEDRTEHIYSGKTGKLQTKIVEHAMEWIGTPYAYSKSEKGVGTDCSGMVMAVYKEVTGIDLPRNSAKQAEFCKSLNKGEIMKGDLVFFATGKDENRISHVGILIDNERFIHASTKKGVVISLLNTPYYIRTFRKFGRVPGVSK